MMRIGNGTLAGVGVAGSGQVLHRDVLVAAESTAFIYGGGFMDIECELPPDPDGLHLGGGAARDARELRRDPAVICDDCPVYGMVQRTGWLTNALSDDSVLHRLCDGVLRQGDDHSPTGAACTG